MKDTFDDYLDEEEIEVDEDLEQLIFKYEQLLAEIFLDDDYD